ncbi:MAG: molybdopterin-dependent oxidoreductase, partial [Gammaproteobacteria bacterium]|nr:molybdopterin-dependent oxidoreductase [Gammaproteobacteria bacterium]
HPTAKCVSPGGVGINLPGNLLANYLTDPDEPIRALFVNSGNPVLSIAGEQHVRKALESLDLLVCVDIYRSATAEYADYLLPAAGAFEREDVNITGMGLQFQPSVQYTEAVVPPAFERKPEWWIFEKLNQTLGFPSILNDASPNVWGRVDAMLRSQGRNMNELKAEQIIALERSDPAEFKGFLQHDDKLVDCFPAIFSDATERMEKIFIELENAPANQLKLIGKRDPYMINSWYSNVARLKTGRRDRNYLFMHPADAELRQIVDGDRVTIVNENGRIVTDVKLTTDLIEGVVAMTHGWGHRKSPGMRVAHGKPGVNCNTLLPSGPGSYEPLSNQAHMTGISVEVRRV